MMVHLKLQRSMRIIERRRGGETGRHACFRSMFSQGIGSSSLPRGTVRLASEQESNTILLSYADIDRARHEKNHHRARGLSRFSFCGQYTGAEDRAVPFWA